MFDAQQRRQLHALGLVPMRLRGQATVEVAEAVAPVAVHEPADTALPRTVPVHLWFPPGEPDALTGPHARLLTQLLTCLDLSPDQIRPGLPDTAETALLLAFGPGAPQGATRFAALAKLRDPIEKRVAWPLLRGLRKHLRQARG